MKKSKIFIIFIIIGLILAFVIGPIFGTTLSKITNDSGTQTISEESDSHFAERYAQPFRLKKDQTCYIRFSNFYPNITVELIILTKNSYHTYYESNGTSPDTGLTFILLDNDLGEEYYNTLYYSLTSYNIPPSGGTYGNNVRIEFRGNGISSWPGEYYIVVEGFNSYGENDEVKFDINVAVDGPGDTVQNIMMIIGIIIVAIVAVIWVYSILKPKEGER
ncbi:MAG: hypothetical protein ACQERB_05565 [Promethearchaeati archaeon]